MKYPKPNTKEWDELVLKKATELKLAIEKEIIRESILCRKSYDKWVKK